MSKAVKLVNNQYLSTQYVVHKRGGGWYYLSNLLDNIYPIGSIFITTNTTNPSTYFGGSWERIKGRFLLAADDSTYKIGKTGGEAEHTLTVDELPTHTHAYGYSIKTYYGYGSTGVNRIENDHASGNQPGDYVWEQGGGGNQPHNNMPPYLVVYIWKRIS